VYLMKHACIVSFTAAALLAPAGLADAQKPATPPLTVVPDVDLGRYMGTWHEIARLPFKYQADCVGDITATYSLRDDGNVTVVNRCRMKDGTVNEAKGLARRASKDGPASKLKVRFAPAWLSFIPAVWGDYWVLVLAPDYSHVAVGEPGRKYLWILSREPSMDEATLQAVLDQVKANGYDVTGLIRSQAPPAAK
jgi:apolipoprotein D and lipocalin family protein